MGAGRSKSQEHAWGQEEEFQDPAQVRDHFAFVLRDQGSRRPALRAVSPPPPVQAPSAPTRSWASMLPARQAPSEKNIYPEKARVESARLSMLRLFPAAFSFCAFLAFAYPILATLCLATDETVQYWVGSYGKLAVFLPIIFLATHLVHTTTRLPSKPAVLCCLVVPSVLLLVLADVVLSQAIDKSDMLFSSNCDAFEGKSSLQHEWDMGYGIYKKCLEATVAKYPQNLTMASAFESYKLQECEEYPGAYQLHKPAWDYLRSLEEKHGCAGWCAVNLTMWSFKEPMDSCSVAAADIFQVKIRRTALHIIVYLVAILLLGCFGMVRFGAIFRKRGLKW